MKLLLGYLLILSLFLLKGYNASFTGAQPEPFHDFTFQGVQKSFIEFNSYRDPEEVFICDDLIDDNEEEFSAIRKKAPVPAYSSSFTGSFIFNSPFNSFNKLPQFYKSIACLFPDKYIFLRVLRV